LPRVMDDIMAWCCGSKRAKDVDAKAPPPLPPGFGRSRSTLLQEFASALSSELEHGWAHAVEDWVEEQGAGWVYSKWVTASDNESDRFWTWCVYTVYRAVRSKRVTVSECVLCLTVIMNAPWTAIPSLTLHLHMPASRLCESWRVPPPARPNSTEQADLRASKQKKLKS